MITLFLINYVHFSDILIIFQMFSPCNILFISFYTFLNLVSPSQQSHLNEHIFFIMRSYLTHLRSPRSVMFVLPKTVNGTPIYIHKPINTHPRQLNHSIHYHNREIKRNPIYIIPYGIGYQFKNDAILQLMFVSKRE